MAWSVACNSGFQTLEDLRAHLRDCEDEEAGAVSCVPDTIQYEVQDDTSISTTTRTKRPRRTTKNSPTAPPLPEKTRSYKKDKKEVQNCSESDTDSEDKCCDNDEPKKPEVDDRCDHKDDMQDSDLVNAACTITKDLKEINCRVKSLYCVLKDAQASAVCRGYSSLIKTLESMMNEAYGAHAMLKKPRTKRSQK